MRIDLSTKTWTYGCEHELADWDATKLPEGFDRDPEPNIVNSNGIAADPSLKSYNYGGEINTNPTHSIESQGSELFRFLKLCPKAKANWRCGLHVHIRIPGLIKNLPALKRLAKFVFESKQIYDFVDPLPIPTPEEFQDHYPQARKRFNWMKMSHKTVIPHYRVEKQLKAKSVEEFMKLEVPRATSGKPLWHAQPRAGINLRQLLQTDTIEFRHFPATTDPQEVINAIKFCRDYLLCCFDGETITSLEKRYQGTKFPTLDTIYIHWQEERWKRTSISKVSRAEVDRNIRRILQEDAWPPC